MNDLPLWPPLVATAFAAASYLVLWLYSRHLDRLDEQERRDAAE